MSMKQHHDTLELYSMALTERQTVNPFLLGFDTVEDKGQTLLEVSVTLIGEDGDDTADDGCETKIFYLDVTRSDRGLYEILESEYSPVNVRDLFLAGDDEYEEIEEFINDKICRVLGGDIRINEVESQEMLVSIESEFDIDLSEIAENDILCSFYVYFK